MSARRGDGTLFAEIPYAAIATIQDPFWSDTIIIHGADRVSRIEIPLATSRIRELLTALAEHIPPYLWDLEESRRFRVPVHRVVMGATLGCFMLVILCFLASGWPWQEILCGALGLAGCGVTLRLAHAYQISRDGVIIRRGVGARFIPASEIATVQLKRGPAHGLPLYVNLLLVSGKQVGLMKADQSAMVIYRTLLAMQRVQK
jgi:hypothetical protein